MNINVQNSLYTLNFKRLNPCSGAYCEEPKTNFRQKVSDVFQKSFGNTIIKKVPIKDTSGNMHTGVIIRRNDLEKKAAFENTELYQMQINGIKAGEILFTDDANDNGSGKITVQFLNVDDCSGGKYKGIGTELLKVAAKRSMEKGHKGRLSLDAVHSPRSPVGFYYKNNFRFSSKYGKENQTKLTAITDYSVRNNISPDKIKGFPNAVIMELDEAGAKALLRGERLYEKRIPEIYEDISFCGNNIPKSKHANEIEISGITSRKTKCSSVKEVTLKNSDNEDVNALILQNNKAKNSYYVCIKKEDKYETLCRMSISDAEDYVFIDSLDGQNNKGIYKGAGTELLKYAVNLSKKNGHYGRIRLLATGSFPFYYKNNLRVAETPSSAYQYFADRSNFSDCASMNAFMDYFSRDNSGLQFVWPSCWEKPEMELTKDCADAFIEGKRLYENNKSELMYKANILYENGAYKHLLNADVIFCEVPTNEESGKCVIQLIQKGNRYIQWLASVEMNFVTNKDGEKYLKIDRINFDDRLIYDKGENAKKAIKDVLLKAAKIKTEELGAKIVAE